MSLRSKYNSRLNSPLGGSSSKSLGSYSIPKISTTAPITPVTINKSLLDPLNIDVDPTVQAVCTKEKEQLKSLNNRFASYIDKVRHLEQQNKMLETKWKLLNGQNAPSSDVEPILKSFIANLQGQLNLLNRDKVRLENETRVMCEHVEEYKTKYEEEFNRRIEAENDFVMLKKDIDEGFLSKVDLINHLSALSDEFNFLKKVYDMELHDLKESVKDTSVVLQMDNSRDLNMNQIISDIKAQYEGVAAYNREEVEKWYKKKFDQMNAEVQHNNNEVQSTEAEILALKQMIYSLHFEIESTKAQHDSIKSNLAEMEEQGEMAMLDAKNRIKDLELALKQAKLDMARQLREYQDLMNVKLALDIEISTYKQLLEGEEERLGHVSIVSIQTVPTKTVPVNPQQRKSGPILIKTVTVTQDSSYNQS